MSERAAARWSPLRHERLAVGGAAVLLLLLQIGGFYDLRHDDAFVTFRYGQNLSRGNGMVFNPGGRTMGSTSPAEVLVSGAVHALVGDERLPSVMSALGCVGWIAAALALYALLRPRAGLGAAAVTALAFACGVTDAANWVALETNAAVALALWALWATTRGRWQLAALLAALATWTRPDAALVVVPMAVVAFRADRWKAWRPAALYVGAVAPWYLFAWRYFGDPLPQSLHAKSATAAFGAYASHVAAFVPGVLVPWLPMALGWGAAIAGWVLVLRRAPELGVVAAYGVLQLGAYLVLRPGAAYVWHLQPIAVVCSVGLVAGPAAFVARRPSRAIHVAGVVAAIALVGWAARRTVALALSHHDAVWFGQRHQVYEDVSTFLRANSRPDDAVSFEEVGTIAYLTDLLMNDRTGLVTRHPEESLRRYQAGEPTRLRWLILRKPELEPARAIYGRRPPLVFRHGQYRVFLFDLRAPEPSDGGPRVEPG